MFPLPEVPNIALLGSGGGERAMVGLLGSLYQMEKEDLLDSILYLCGVSGSTWCMSSLYKESNWSEKIEEQKKIIVHRLWHDHVSRLARGKKLLNYFQCHDNFNLTDAWAALVVPELVKEIDENTLSSHREGHCKDPYPIYTIIDQDSKYTKLEEKDRWFELTPHEAGYSIMGAFVDTTRFGSQFDKGKLTKSQPERDMLYIQGLCGSAVADKEVILEELKKLIEGKRSGMNNTDSTGPLVLQKMVELLLGSIREKDCTPLLIELNSLLEAPDVAPQILTEKRHFEDAAALLNSPYFCVLRPERQIDLIISLDFSAGNPMETVVEAHKKCKEMKIPFPTVVVSPEDAKTPKDFYVFKGINTPTVIHMPLFNIVNCKDKDLSTLREKYKTFQGAYSPEMITELMELAGQNITNNRKHLLREIEMVSKRTTHQN
ncbi:cytosolic phospholipase A2 gamma-like [Osmerus mordax]|uniref:cytosolic phospholipase A2 gamma-like n=1 Tax=Osmerus mordax TaxID=8014 RepID=UPI00351071E4